MRFRGNKRPRNDDRGTGVSVFCSLWLSSSFMVLCSETARKRLLRRLINKRFGKLGLESCKGATGILGCFLKSGKRKFKQAQRRLRTPAPTPPSYGPFLPHLNLAVPSLEKLLRGPWLLGQYQYQPWKSWLLALTEVTDDPNEVPYGSKFRAKTNLVIVRCCLKTSNN